MNDELRRILQNQKILLRQVFGDREIGLVFPSARDGKVNRPGNISTMIKLAAKDAGIEHFSAHAFRHTFASTAVDSGVEPQVLKTILGHENIRVTIDTYYHSDGKKEAEAMQRMNKVLVPFRKIG